MMEPQKVVHRKLPIIGYPQLEFFILDGQKMKITRKNFTCQLHPGTSADVPKQIQKFYRKRFFLFKKFNEGIQLDEESWYSVIPEEMSCHIANKLKVSSPDSDVVDGFCGSGGLAIQLAKCFKSVTCIDIDPVKINNITNNLQVYESMARILQLNFLEYTHNKQDVILVMCPPWGGLSYSHQTYDLNNMKPSLQELLTKGLQMTEKIVLQLPKNIELKQLVSIFKEILSPQKQSYYLLTSRLINQLYTMGYEYIVFLINIILSTYINLGVNEYMDEEFHLDQMQHYLDSDFTYWNPKLTTPPMLYVLNYPFVMILTKFGLNVLNSCRFINTFIYPTITFIVLRKVFGDAQKALLFSLLPTIYFYNFLFYTDSLSITFLALAYSMTQSKQYLLSGLFSLCSVMSRQTNIIWVIYICIKDYLDINQTKLQFKDPRLSIFFHCKALLNMMYADIRSILMTYKYHFCVVLLFLGFLYENKGIVLGDRTNHQVVFHAPQILYFLPVLFLYFPINWSMLYEYTRLSLKRIIVSRNAKFTYTIILLLCIEVVHHWTYEHPFILSDNRHYVFYIWRRILSKEIFRFGLCTIYALIIVVLGRILIAKKEQVFQQSSLWFFTACQLVPSPLIEPRYFSIPLLFFYIQANFIEQKLKMQCLVFGIVNCILIYIFCEVKFECDFPACRFMF